MSVSHVVKCNKNSQRKKNSSPFSFLFAEVQIQSGAILASDRSGRKTTLWPEQKFVFILCL